MLTIRESFSNACQQLSTKVSCGLSNMIKTIKNIFNKNVGEQQTKATEEQEHIFKSITWGLSSNEPKQSATVTNKHNVNVNNSLSTNNKTRDELIKFLS